MPGVAHSRNNKLRLEVVDVSSTAVSLAIHTQTEAALGANGIEIKLNSEPWPKTVISDPAFYQDDTPNSNGATVVIYGLEPGRDYEIELDVVQSSQTTQGTAALPSPIREDPMPREPPPPYSSHDPSSPSTPPSAAAVRIQTAQQKEHDLKATLKKTTQAAKEAESSLQGPLGALKRQLEKSHKEDQRARQKISTLEEATRKIREAIQHEAVLMEDLHAEIEPLQAQCDALAGELEGQKERWQAADLAAKEAVEADEDATQRLKDQLDELISREEGLEAERARYEDEVLPDLKSRLAYLDAELKRLEGDPSPSGSSNNSFFYSTTPEPRSRSSSFKFKGISKKNLPIQAQQQYLESYFAGPAHAPHPIPLPQPYPYAALAQNSSSPSLPDGTPERSRRSSDGPSKPARKASDPPLAQRIVPGLPSFKSSKATPAAPVSAPAPSTSESPKFLAGLRKRSNSLLPSTSTSAKVLVTTVVEQQEGSVEIADRVSVDSAGKEGGGLGAKMSWSKVVGRKS